jgi:hypothetical protein
MSANMSIQSTNFHRNKCNQRVYSKCHNLSQMMKMNISNVTNEVVEPTDEYIGVRMCEYCLGTPSGPRKCCSDVRAF